ncbi:hypothetical protein QTI24_01455 [Variovorax sp. J22P240]|uniref:hypothetical protein n=1 Tax=Variovorax sp. J22P240 TaxID=3053514 RepID=UPI0025774895|nr:hypothetical protein [Variovorax sp. J22P240]MDL9997248.1 hypothetical protein [Variovorax sp. J22P240]
MAARTTLTSEEEKAILRLGRSLGMSFARRLLREELVRQNTGHPAPGHRDEEHDLDDRALMPETGRGGYLTK